MNRYHYALLFSVGFTAVAALMWYAAGVIAMLAFMAGAFYVQSGVMAHETMVREQ